MRIKPAVLTLQVMPRFLDQYLIWPLEATFAILGGLVRAFQSPAKHSNPKNRWHSVVLFLVGQGNWKAQAYNVVMCNARTRLWMLQCGVGVRSEW